MRVQKGHFNHSLGLERKTVCSVIKEYDARSRQSDCYLYISLLLYHFKCTSIYTCSNTLPLQ